MDLINFSDFEKIDLRLIKIISAERIENSEKLLKILAETGQEKKQIIAGIGKFYSPEDLIGKTVVAIINLEPRMIVGLESQAMILAVKSENDLSLIVSEKDLPFGLKLS
ncbi:MAG: methionine--tRNA ligase subunit beta [Candidatus Paceibacterota bacterium]